MPSTLPGTGPLPADLSLTFTNAPAAPYADALLPDSEIIFGAAAAEFDTAAYIARANGYLSHYQEEVKGETLSGAEIVQRVARDNAINPCLLLALLEYQAHWVHSLEPTRPPETALGFQVVGAEGLYWQLVLTVRYLSIGYYGWRDGSQTRLEFMDGSNVRLAPALNPGSVALQTLFAQLNTRAGFEQALYGPNNFLTFYAAQFGDPWQRAANQGAQIPAELQQPAWELPWAAGESWYFTAGPHIAWNHGSPRAALDFAPPDPQAEDCGISSSWVRAIAPGRVMRAERGSVIVDLDDDGNEGTGWVVLYMHIAGQGRVSPGTWVDVSAPIGHPSCEGGISTGTHVHIARKYNGEWIPINPDWSWSLSGWQAIAGAPPYKGQLQRNGQVILSNPLGSEETRVSH
jgi:murein DD-endopeptidase MepM/ murein hydrolase activator NlpD